jgi:hypothetical protein
MEDIINRLKEKEGKIVSDAYKIAIVKQDIALGLIESIKEILSKGSPIKFSDEQIADKIFEKVKKIPNKDIQIYIQADKRKKKDLRLKIEKRLIKDFKK